MVVGCNTRDHYFLSVNWIYDILHQLEHYSLTHVFQNVNQVVNMFVKYGLQMVISYRTFDVILNFASFALLANRSGIAFSRGF